MATCTFVSTRHRKRSGSAGSCPAGSRHRNSFRGFLRAYASEISTEGRAAYSKNKGLRKNRRAKGGGNEDYNGSRDRGSQEETKAKFRFGPDGPLKHCSCFPPFTRLPFSPLSIQPLNHSMRGDLENLRQVIRLIEEPDTYFARVECVETPEDIEA